MSNNSSNKEELFRSFLNPRQKEQFSLHFGTRTFYVNIISYGYCPCIRPTLFTNMGMKWWMQNNTNYIKRLPGCLKGLAQV